VPDNSAWPSYLGFAIRYGGGILLAADRALPPADDTDTRPIRAIGRDFGAVLHDPDGQAGWDLLERMSETLSGSASADFLMRQLPELCRKMNTGGNYGILFAGSDPEARPPLVLIGTHSQRDFSPLMFGRNAFGGLNLIARNLDRQLWTPGMSVEKAGQMAAFMLVESRAADPMPCGEFAVMATVTCAGGFAPLGGEKIGNLLTEARDKSVLLRSRCSDLLLMSQRPGIEAEGVQE
jgi:hypothetical protein